MSNEEIKYEEYGYAPNTPITISSELFGQLSELIDYIGKKETVLGIEQKEKLEDTLGEANPVKPILTIQGIKALTAALAMNEVHRNNVTNGTAVHRDILEAPLIGEPAKA